MSVTVAVYPSGEYMPGMPGSSFGPVPIVTLYGVTMDGNSVAAHAHGFLPYFHVPAVDGFKAEDCEIFRVCTPVSFFINKIQFVIRLTRYQIMVSVINYEIQLYDTVYL